MSKITYENVEHVGMIPVEVRKGEGVKHTMVAAPVMMGTWDIRTVCGMTLGQSADDTIEVGAPELDGGTQCKRCSKIYSSLLDERSEHVAAVVAKVESEATEGPAGVMADETKPAPAAALSLPPGEARDKAVAKLWADMGEAKPAKDAGQATSRQSPWKSVKEAPEVVRCEPDAKGEELPDGSGVCSLCSWHGPMKLHKISPAVKGKGKRTWCKGAGKAPQGAEYACPDCGRTDVKESRVGGLCRHKTPAVGAQEAVTEMRMTSHYRGGRAPQQLTMPEDHTDTALAARPATVDSGDKRADDTLGGAVAGMYKGRTSLTRGTDMTGAAPRDRAEGAKPVPTTNDAPLGGNRLDVSARKGRKIVATPGGAKVVSDMQGGPRGWLTRTEYQELTKTEQRTYRRKVAKCYRDAERAAQLRAHLDKQAAIRRQMADKAAGKRIAATAPSARKGK